MLQDAGNHCPVCGGGADFAYPHSQAEIWRCRVCRHAFTRVDSLAEQEAYDQDYYLETHRNWFLNPNLRLFRWIAERMGRGGAVLDVGCGKGDFLRWLRDNHPGHDLVGVDLSPNHPEAGITYLQGDAAGLDFGRRFDAVVSLAAIEHVPDIRAFAQMLGTLCRPGGRVFVMTLNESGLLYRLSRLALHLGVPLVFERLYSPHHLHHFSTASLTRLLSEAGMVIETVHHHNCPLKALDMPVKGALARLVLKAGVAAVFLAGSLFGSCYLQTVVGIPAAPAEG